jgi:hypothetical protein
MRTRLEEAKAAAEISSKITEAETGTSKIGAGILARLGFPAPIKYCLFLCFKNIFKKN